jgi:beta-phosphoglucomutase-like phosphatase (HAD superfamily)
VVAAIAFDLNGTLSRDEELYYAIFAELFAREGKPVSEEEYFGRLVGHVDEQLVKLWLGEDFPRVEELLAERIERFLALVEDGRTVGPDARAAVRAASEAVPIAVVSGAFRREVDAILDGAELRPYLRSVVALEDVVHPKPDPEAYALAAARLGLPPSSVLAVEDTRVGIAAAKAAGMRCVAVRGSQAEAALAGADEIVERLDASTVERLLSL